MRSAFRSACLLIMPAAICLALANRSSGQTSSPHYFRNAIALCIGIDRYRFLPEATFAEADATAVAAALKGQYGFTTETLLGSAATRGAITGKLTELTAEGRVSDQDVVVIYFAGHGQVINTHFDEAGKSGRQGFLVPYDASLDSLEDFSDPARWRSSCLDMSWLISQADKIPARHVLILCDACCSGFLTQRGSGGNVRRDLKFLLDGKSLAVISATTDRQPATPDQARKHGHFTAAFLDELKARSEGREAASLTDLFENVRRQVAASTKGQMIPQMNSRLRSDPGEFIFLPGTIFKRDIEALKSLVMAGAAAAGRGHVLEQVLERARERENFTTKLSDLLTLEETYGDFRYGKDAAKDESLWKAKFNRFFTNATNGEALAMAALHYCYARGYGTEKNDALALRWAQDAYETGVPAGKHVLARCYLLGVGATPNRDAAFELLREAGDGKFPLSLAALGVEAAKDALLTKNPAQTTVAQAFFKQAAEAGSTKALVDLANTYSGSQPGEQRDLSRAISLLRQAAEKGNVLAMYQLYGVLSSAGPEKNLPEAEKMLRAAADKGFSEAQVDLGFDYYGKDKPLLVLKLPRDIQRAKTLFELAAAQGNPRGHMLLADMYLDGAEQIRPDFQTALKHLKAAADSKWSSAFGKLATVFAVGKHIKPDMPAAVEYAQQGAALNDPDSCFVLGLMYADELVPRNTFKAEDYYDNKPITKHYTLHYLTKAAKAGNATAKKMLKEQFAPQIRSTPKLVYWQYFKRDFPESVSDFSELAGIPKDGD